MRFEDIINDINKERWHMCQQIMDAPPQDYEEYARRRGMYQGLGKALMIIDERRKEAREDD